MTTITNWAQSKYGFYTDRHYQNDKWILQKSPIKLAPYHAQILEHCFTPDDTGRLPYDTIAWCEPAKSGKSAIAGLVAEYIALHGEKNSQIIMASNKQNQAASLMFKSLTDSIEYNSHLPNVSPNRLEVTFKNGNQVKAIPSNSKGEAGARFSLALFDELWGYVHQDAERLFAEFKTDPTRLNSVKFCIGYAGYLESKLWLDLLKTGLDGYPVLPDIVNEDGTPSCWANGRHFTFWSDTCRQQWQTEQWKLEQKKSLRDSEYRRMIKCEFVEGQGDFVELDAWQDCIVTDHLPVQPGSDESIWLGLDIATSPKGDDCALVGCYEKDEKIFLGLHKLWKGRSRHEKLKLSETVLPFILNLNNHFNISGVAFDPYQGLLLAELLEKNGIYTVEIHQNHSNRGWRDTNLWQLISDRRLILYNHPQVKTASNQANAKELGDGRLFITKANRKHKIDFMVALSNASSEAIEGNNFYIGSIQWPVR